MLEVVIAVIGGMCGVLSVIYNFVTYKMQSNGFLSDFISNANDREFIDAKIKIYELGDNKKDNYFENCQNIRNEISFIVNFFNNAGILVYKKRLPFWIFREGGWGYISMKIFEILYEYIQMERKTHDKRHCYYYEFLYYKIKKSNYYKNTIAK